MDFGNIISNSFRYPFKDLKHLGFVFLLFLLTVILPIGVIINNEITRVIGVIALLVFVLVAPGYMMRVVNAGVRGSLEIPSINLRSSVVNTFKLLVLHICYITIPSIVVFLILSLITGLWNFSAVSSSIGAVTTTFIWTVLMYCIFSIVSFIAKARLAKYGSLVEALKLKKVLKDIREIGISRFICWFLVMIVLIEIIKTIAILVMFIPYVGFIFYFVIVAPIITLVFYYSLGLLYSNSDDWDKSGDWADFEKFEKEIEYLKYGRLD